MREEQNVTYRRLSGSTLALTVSVVGVVILVVAFVLFNFLQGANVQKEGQTAADAAAIAVAKEMSRIVVDTPTNIGRVGLVDNYSPAGVNAQPIFGINTLVGRARLDALIAKDLNNTTMQFLARQDLNDIKLAKTALRSQLVSWAQGNPAKDSSGATIPPAATVARNAYLANQRRAGQSGELQNLTCTIGVVGGSGGVTNIPLPEPNDLNKIEINSSQFAEVNGRKFYRANVPIAVQGVDNFRFAEIGDDVKLSDRASFQDVAASTNVEDLPTAVKVEATETAVATATSNRTTINDIACATAGGRRVSPTAGILRLEFPQGIPQGQPVAGDTRISFQTVKDIMNAVQLSADGSSGQNVWKGNGKYFTAKNGSFPGSGNIVPAGFRGRPSDNPSVMTAFFVYDWLKGEALRPRMDCVRAALTKDLVAFGLNGDGTYSNASERAIAMTPNGEFLMQPAIAQWGDPIRTAVGTDVYGAIFNMKAFPNSDLAMISRLDPRSIENHTRCQNEDQAAVFRMQMSAAQQCAFAGPTAMAHGKNADDIVTTVDLHDIQDALDYFDAIGRGQVVAMDAYKNGREVQLGGSPSHQDEAERLANEINQRVARQEDITNELQGMPDGPRRQQLENEYQQLMNEINQRKPPYLEHQRIINRAQDVQLNAREAIQDMNALVNNMMAFSAAGLGKVNANHFVVGDRIDFLPPVRVPTKAEIEGTALVSTGQPDTNLGDEAWCRGNTTAANAPPTANPYFVDRPGPKRFVLQGADQCGAPGTIFELPAIAQANNIFPTSVGQNFRFTTQGDASFARDGCVLISLATTPFFNASTGVQQLMQGQRQFQALNVYREKSNHPDIHLVWSIMAQDNAFNANVNPPEGSGAEKGADARQMAENPASAPPELEGNLLDCANADTNLDQRIRACRYNAVQIQITSPLMFTEKIPDPVPPPPPPVGDPEPPKPSPPIPPPPPPPSSH